MSAAGGKAPPPVSPSIFSYVPYHDDIYRGYVTVRSYAEWFFTEHLVGKFILETLTSLNPSPGQKNLMIKIPEAIYKVAHRFEHSPAKAAHLLKSFAHTIKPLIILAPCAKSFLAFGETAGKVVPIFKQGQDKRRYVVFETTGDVQKPLQASYKLENWEQWLNKGELIAHWAISFCESEAGYQKMMNNGPSRLTTLARILSPLVSAKILYMEGSFLYKTLQPAEDKHDVGAVDKKKAKLAKQEIYGSALKIALAVICLSLDLFNKFGSKEKQSVWLETTIFWASVAPAFVGTAAHFYWPKLVLTPLQNSVGIR
ncbi:MAG: hypothetical protein JSS10_01900 [Verrucomicrobia bacterium]|nr:hypothetical protein [Verrucomicrobiota bacterium]